ncbi:MAG: hypothetical protein AW09_000983 [Candidatus Accumulibacter phosphatis]|uniref:Uncharacterized protein n=1 Tax=Candidatus Accumulibacter phosphatis TaxID=327160 RepID=A0A080LXW4_9PROT|nr:MAG: hypothetical protein AW09_000983 [Candidatus Accumulibacter phosphatis]
MTRLEQTAFLFGQRGFESSPVGTVLGGHFPGQFGGIAVRRDIRPIGQFGVDARERRALALVLGHQRSEIGVGDPRVHAHQHLPGTNGFSFADQNLLDDAGFGRLYDLQVALRDQFAFGNGDDVELAEQRPAKQRCKQGQQGPEHLATERIGRRVSESQQGW